MRILASEKAAKRFDPSIFIKTIGETLCHETIMNYQCRGGTTSGKKRYREIPRGVMCLINSWKESINVCLTGVIEPFALHDLRATERTKFGKKKIGGIHIWLFRKFTPVFLS